MYYLNSRYYDPEVGRFINADEYASTGQGFLGCNMFVYCLNNPVNMLDCSGEIPWYYLPGSAKSAYIDPNSIKPTANNRTYIRERMIEGKLKSCYTTNEATHEINEIVSKYSEKSFITFKPEGGFRIEDSCFVDSVYDRQKICMIAERTVRQVGNYGAEKVVERDYRNMAAEWELHNEAYFPLVALGLESFSEKAKHVDIEKIKDGRWIIREGTKFFDAMGWR